MKLNHKREGKKKNNFMTNEYYSVKLPEISFILISLARGNFFDNDRCKIFSPSLRVATLGVSVYLLKAN